MSFQISQNNNGVSEAVFNSTVSEINIQTFKELASLRLRLRRGVSGGFVVIGDSTGVADTNWPYLVAGKLATTYPNYTINFYRWNGTVWGTISRLQSGPAGERGWQLTGGTCIALASSEAVHPTGDWEISCGYSHPDWQNALADNVLVSAKWGTIDGFHSIYLGVNASNQITLNWCPTTGLLADKITVTSDALTTVNNQEYWVKATLDIDNGASGYDVKFYTSADRGVTWVQLGATVTGVGVTNVKNGGGNNWALGGHQQTNYWQGTIYRADIKNGIGGRSILPLVADGWSGFTTTNMVGSPELNIINGSISGSSFSSWSSFAHYDILLRNYKPDVVFINLSHNSTNLVGSTLFTQIDAVVAAIRSRLAEPHIIILSGNPTVAPANYRTETTIRQSMIGSYCLRKGYGFIDTCLAFPIDPTAYLAVDGLHPNGAGQELMANYIFKAISSAQ